MSMLKLNDLQRPTCNSTNTIGIFEAFEEAVGSWSKCPFSEFFIFSLDFVFVFILKTEKQIKKLWKVRRMAGLAAYRGIRACREKYWELTQAFTQKARQRSQLWRFFAKWAISGVKLATTFCKNRQRNLGDFWPFGNFG